jgi:tRNA A37 methylthiotransferase MiaB
MSKKVFIKTFGCQMNEYDSDKMADVLGAAQGYTPTQKRGRSRPDPVQHVFGA